MWGWVVFIVVSVIGFVCLIGCRGIKMLFLIIPTIACEVGCIWFWHMFQHHTTFWKLAPQDLGAIAMMSSIFAISGITACFIYFFDADETTYGGQEPTTGTCSCGGSTNHQGICEHCGYT